MSNGILLAVSVLLVIAVVIPLNFESMYGYYTYGVIVKNADIDNDYTHIGYLSPNTLNYPIAIKNIILLDDETINVEFDNDHPVLSSVPHFTYETNIKPGQSFLFDCEQTDDGRAYITLFEYLGTTKKDGQIVLAMNHGFGITKNDISCKYPDVIRHSIDAIDLDVSIKLG